MALIRDGDLSQLAALRGFEQVGHPGVFSGGGCPWGCRAKAICTAVRRRQHTRPIPCVSDTKIRMGAVNAASSVQ
jgi:hypothetical protein